QTAPRSAAGSGSRARKVARLIRGPFTRSRSLRETSTAARGALLFLPERPRPRKGVASGESSVREAAKRFLIGIRRDHQACPFLITRPATHAPTWSTDFGAGFGHGRATWATTAIGTA